MHILGRSQEEILQRIAKYVEQIPFIDCHIWTGSRSRSKYPYPSMTLRELGNRNNRKTFKVHRLIYELKNGEIGNRHVLHTCDNSLCVNPDHLILGTHQDNMRHMVERNRCQSGMKSPNAKLTDDNVRLMRKLYSEGHHTTRSLAKLFGVNPKHVWKIVTFKKWRKLK